MGPTGLSPDNDLGGPGGGSDISNNISCRVRQLQPGQTITVDVTNGTKFSSQTITLDFAEQPSLVPLTPTSYTPFDPATSQTTWAAARTFTNNSGAQGDATVQVSFSVTPPPGPSPGTARAETVCQCTGDAATPNITVLKETEDANGNPVSTSDNFGFEISPTTPTISFDLNTQNNNPETSNTFTVDAGQSYTITETPTSPWTLQSVSCQINNGTPFSPTITNNSITLDPLGSADEAVCTFTNQFPADTAEITVLKETVDADGNLLSTADDFGFEIDTQPPTSFSLNTQNNNPQTSQTITVITGQSFSIAETPASSWSLETVTCMINGGTSFEPTITNNAITLDPLQDGDAAECTFRNRFADGPPPPSQPTGSLEVRKVTIGGDDNFRFSVSGQSSFVLRNGDHKTFSQLTAGTYTIREVGLPQGWELRNVSCTKSGRRSGNGITVDVSEGDAVVCTFTNFKNEDERMQDLTELFVYRRVDNLLTYGPGRSRILRRLQEEPIEPLKGSPLKYADGAGAQTSANPKTAEPYAPGYDGVRAQRLGQSAGRLGHSITEHSGPQIPFGYSGGLFNNGGNIFAQDRSTWPGGGALNQSSGAFGRAGPHKATGILPSLGAQFVPLAQGEQGSFKFSTSLSEMRSAAADAEKQKLEQAGLGFTEFPYQSPYSQIRPGLDVWIEGQFLDYRDNTAGISRDGDFSILYGGVDYLLAPGVLVGAIVQVDWTDEDINDPSVRGGVEGTGWMAGPYVGLRLTDYLFFDARAAWGTSDNDIRITDQAAGRRSASFDTDRWLASANLTGNHFYNAWRLSPQIGIDYGSESFDTFRNSLSQIVRGSDASIGRLRGGAELGYRMQTSGGTIVEPTLSIEGLWAFDNGDFLVNGVPVDFDDGRAKLEGGVIITTPTGWSFRGAGIYDGIGANEFDAYGGQFWVNIPLN